jgi:YesN/AraC family two-component response regulator
MENEFRNFIKERESLNLSALAKELKTDRVYLSKIINGSLKIPKNKRGLFLEIMTKYGYAEKT